MIEIDEFEPERKYSLSDLEKSIPDGYDGRRILFVETKHDGAEKAWLVEKDAPGDTQYKGVMKFYLSKSWRTNTLMKYTNTSNLISKY